MRRAASVAVSMTAAYPSCNTISAPFSPIMMVAALVLPETTVGITEASTTRSRSTPRTRNCGSTTAIGCLPIVQVLVGW